MTNFRDRSLCRSYTGALLLALTACSGAAQAASYTMFKDPNCGCCDHWADHVREGMEAEVAVTQSADMAAVKDELAGEHARSRLVLLNLPPARAVHAAVGRRPHGEEP